MITAFLGGRVGDNPSDEVFEYFSKVKLKLYQLNILALCPLDISRDIYRSFGDEKETWELISDQLMSCNLDMALFLIQTPSGSLGDSEGSSREITKLLIDGIPIYVIQYDRELDKISFLYRVEEKDYQ